ncbi:Uncharacterized conserved protein, DUF427 family [Actinopolymorpha cephalotaxi]|uniref:Uncharacterized conserved protein, DUF427 family n=1 Tax=Actinopolymorpha cephalotaxi TaxID=504797 RepID=A0A1I2W740_9ACTN|nr:DUF427 domain-containing protein [Actinopolymorpha cephalotaxi]NYH82716.1 uncharacterized protein (DUF427 family) [Actinopolymorpha cephalotaxi]SFG97214.1 Uncharacterized conserved protein, DUF427 family [Actinopolymorpha cephalotaxi]
MSTENRDTQVRDTHDRAASIRVETSPKRVRVMFGGHTVADSEHALLVWEKPYYPTYFLPARDVRTDAFRPTGGREHAPGLGEAEIHTVVVGEREATGAALWYRDSPVAEVQDTIRLDWNAMDAWFEEDEEVYVHPRDPYKRVDVLASSRHVRVEVGGVTVAETTRARILFETGLPPRYYLPKTDVRLDLLEPTALQTQCPYKGTASYYTVVADGGRHENLAWWYQHPTLESVKIAGLIAFYNEKIDLYVDGRHLPRPTTPFS